MPDTTKELPGNTDNRTDADICLCGAPRHYHLDEDGASPVHKPGVGACMTRKHCVQFAPVGSWNA